MNKFIKYILGLTIITVVFTIVDSQAVTKKSDLIPVIPDKALAKSVCKARWLVGTDTDTIIFTDLDLGAIKYYSFRLDSFDIKPYKLKGEVTYKKKPGFLEYEKIVPYKVINNKYRSFSLETSKKLRRNSELYLKKNNLIIIKLGDDSYSGAESKNFGFTDNGLIISGGKEGRLEAFNKEGKRIAIFKGHDDYIASIIIDGDRLISSSFDKTIRVWNLNEVNKGKTEILPVVGMYSSFLNKEWVIWNNQGFYNASANGDKLMGWTVKKRHQGTAGFYSANQFKKHLFRPDIIKKTLELGSGELALEFMTRTEPELKKITASALIIRAPQNIEIESFTNSGKGYGDIKIRLGQNKTTPLERITIYINGFQVLKNRDRIINRFNPGGRLTYRVKLPNRTFNHIKITAENKWAESTAIKLFGGSHHVPGKMVIDDEVFGKGNLFVVAIGIKNYPNLSKEQQLNSPPVDAQLIAKTFKKLQDTRIFKNVDVLLLTDESGEKITSDMVEKAVLKQTSKAGPMDTTLIFLAGHGITDLKGNYHFVTADTKIKSAYGMQEGIHNGTSYNWERLHRALDSAMGRRIVFVDTCQAGKVFSESNTNIAKLVKDIHDVNAIVYSGTSRQDSGIETKKGGVFTLSLINSINKTKRYSFLKFIDLKKAVDREVPKRNSKIKKQQIKRAIKLDILENKNLDYNDTQKPVGIIPEGMEGLVIYQKK